MRPPRLYGQILWPVSDQINGVPLYLNIRKLELHINVYKKEQVQYLDRTILVYKEFTP